MASSNGDIDVDELEEDTSNELGKQEDSEGGSGKQYVFKPLPPRKLSCLLQILNFVLEHRELMYASFSPGSNVTREAKTQFLKRAAKYTHELGLTKKVQDHNEWTKRFFGTWKRNFYDRKTARNSTGNGHIPVEEWEELMRDILQVPKEGSEVPEAPKNTPTFGGKPDLPTGKEVASSSARKEEKFMQEWVQKSFNYPGDQNMEESVYSASVKSVSRKQSLVEESREASPDFCYGTSGSTDLANDATEENVDFLIKKAQLAALRIKNEQEMLVVYHDAQKLGLTLPLNMFEFVTDKV